jgi:hypothetical protein
MQKVVKVGGNELKVNVSHPPSGFIAAGQRCLFDTIST